MELEAAERLDYVSSFPDAGSFVQVASSSLSGMMTVVDAPETDLDCDLAPCAVTPNQLVW